MQRGLTSIIHTHYLNYNIFYKSISINRPKGEIMNRTLKTTISIQDTVCEAEIEYSFHEGQQGTHWQDEIRPYVEIEKFTAWFPFKSRKFDAKSCRMIDTVILKELNLLTDDYFFLVDGWYFEDFKKECLADYLSAEADYYNNMAEEKYGAY